MFLLQILVCFIYKHVKCLARRSSIVKFKTTTIFVAQNSRKMMKVEWLYFEFDCTIATGMFFGL